MDVSYLIDAFFVSYLLTDSKGVNLQGIARITSRFHITTEYSLLIEVSLIQKNISGATQKYFGHRIISTWR